jgi:bla regulator protein BlaR1
MNTHPDMIAFVTWLLNHSLQAGVLVVLVLLVQWIFRARLTSRWRFALWWVVLVRLLLPFGPQSAVSLFNYFHPTVPVAQSYQASQPIAQPQPQDVQTMDVNSMHDRVARSNPSEPATVVHTQPSVSHSSTAAQPPLSSTAEAAAPMRARNYRDLILPIAVTAWLAGMVLLAIYVLAQILRFQWRLSRSTVSAEPASAELLRDCQQEFGVMRRIELLETNAVGSPALFGLFKLRLLLPKGFTEKFSRNELRYVFLHELAHVKRGDLWLNWLITALQIAHWFNPLIWLGFARLRSDRELACDELALMHAGEKTGTLYGETVVKLLEGLSHPAAIPGLVGILEDKKQMRRRILMIANFKKPGRWSALAILLVGAIAAATLTDAQTQNPKTQAPPNTTATIKSPEKDSGTGPHANLIGTVHAKGGGPLAADVLITTAAPKSGNNAFGQTYYLPDSGKSTTADAQGAFEIKSLNPELNFRILAIAKGYKPKFVPDVDPAKGPLNVELEPISDPNATPDRSLHGIVLDNKGKPLEGATVEANGIETKDGSTRYGTIQGVDQLVVTDANGEFLITSQKPFDMLDVKVTARGLAPKTFTKLSSGTVHELALAEGASVTGRVLFEGKPLKDVSVGISAVDRSAGHYLGKFETGTGPDGKFALANIPPDADFYVYTKMSTMKQFGAVPAQKFRTAADGASTDLGDLITRPAFRLQGRMVLADGQPLPPNTRLTVALEGVMDSMQIPLDENGGFDTTGIPAGIVQLSARVPGYHISAKNKSLDRLNLIFLSGRVDHDITGLIYLFEKGPTPRPDLGNSITAADMPENRSLRGAEGEMDHSHEWAISGHVIDSETKEPLASFHVTPGQTDNFDRTGWQPIESVDGTNGSYLVYINQRIDQPLLKVEAEGYLPGSISLPPQDSDHADIALTKGTGPSGTVVDSEGKPAAGATLVLLCDGVDQVGFNSSGELTAYWNEKIKTTTDATGHFKLPPELGMKKIAAASSNGLTIVSLEELAAHPEIRLEPFGRITGTLKRPSGPGTNEDLDLAFADKTTHGLPRINLNHHAITDAQGHFSFEHVPATLLQLSYRVPMGDRSWQNEPLQQVDVKPGQALDLQVNASDRIAARKDDYQPPVPKRIPGAELKGYVLLPSGLPAAEADVAVQVDGVYLALNKATLTGNSPRENGMLVTASADGSFVLPMFEGAQSVIAVSEQGIAIASIDAFKASPTLTLQQWGRVEGTLQINHHPASNEKLSISQPPQVYQYNAKNGTNEVAAMNARINAPRLIYDYNAFQTKTDQRGHFAFSFIPPGDLAVYRQVPLNDERTSSVSRELGIVKVKPGETTTTNFSSDGRNVNGRLKFDGTNSPDLKNSTANLAPPHTKLLVKLQSAKTPEERKAILNSEASQVVMTNHTAVGVRLRADGSFSAEAVPPGTYELSVQPEFRGFNRLSQMPTNMVMFASEQTIVIPPFDKNETNDIDAGTLNLKAYNLPMFMPIDEKP